MSVQLKKSTFRKVVLASGLLTAARMDETDRKHPGRTATPESWCDLLIELGDLTSWQAQKLLQARHRGFQLGQFQLRSKLARGGMSTIYVAREKESGRDCVLKVLPLSRVAKASYLPRFQREARITIGLRHPNVVRVFDLHCESDGKEDIHFISMELLDGENLSELVKRTGPLNLRLAADLIRQAALGLAFAHEAGLVHRDVKPANFVLTSGNVIKVLDLGLASSGADEEEDLSRQYDERVLGTADYLSPEQAVDSHHADGRADIYSLGCTLYFLLTGRPPFPDGLLAERILAHQTRQPIPITSHRTDVPPEFQTILERMLVKNRNDRTQSATEVSNQLSVWLEKVADDSSFDTVPEMDLQNSGAAQKDQLAGQTQTNNDTAPLRPAGEVPMTDSALSGVYTPEFESFLKQLDEESGISTVVNDNVRKQQLSVMSHLPAKTPEDQS